MVYVDKRHDYIPGMGTLVNACGSMVTMSDGDANAYWAKQPPCPPQGPLMIPVPGGLPPSTNPSYVNTPIPGMIGTFPVLSLADAIAQHLSFQTAPGIANQVGLGTETVQNLVNDVPAFVADYCSIRPAVSGCNNPGALITNAQGQLTDYYRQFIAAARTQAWNYPGLQPAVYTPPPATSNVAQLPPTGSNPGGNTYWDGIKWTVIPNPVTDPIGYTQYLKSLVPGMLPPATSPQPTNYTHTIPTPTSSNPTSGIVDFTNPQNLGAGSVPVPATGNSILNTVEGWTSKTWLEIGAVGLVALIGFGMMKGR